MPRVLITFDPENSFFSVQELPKGVEHDPEYQVVMDMKASHYRNIRRNFSRFNADQKTLMAFFIETQIAGKVIREQ